MTNLNNPLLNIDSYKLSHKGFYPAELAHVYSYIESRGGRWSYTTFFGLQMYLMNLKPFTAEDIMEFIIVSNLHGFKVDDLVKDFWLILEEYGGHWPVEIRAVPEGTNVPTSNVLVDIVNTDKRFPWVTQMIETELLRAVWYPTTVATLSNFVKRRIKRHLEETSDIASVLLASRLHDFGARGSTSREAAGIGGVAHLVNFAGTDTMTALLYAQKYYAEPMAGFSIPATEHSISTSYGPRDEVGYATKAVELLETGKYPFVACVGDTYDIYKFVRDVIGTKLRDRIKNSGGTIVIRPDSGDPTIVPLDVLEILGDKFGYEVNSKGFKVLHSSVRVVQGDGMNDVTIPTLLENLVAAGWSTENIVLGMGGGLLQKVDRDTLKFAMKASAIKFEYDYAWNGVSKRPITDPGKTSKEGRLSLIKRDGTYETVSRDITPVGADILQVVYLNGVLHNVQTLSEIRDRSEIS